MCRPSSRPFTSNSSRSAWRSHLPLLLRHRVAAGVYRYVDALPVEGIHQGQAEVGEGRRFSAADGDPSAGLLVEDPVGQQLLQQLGHGVPPGPQGESPEPAGVLTGSAGVAPGPVHLDGPVPEGEGLLGADIQTLSEPGTQIRLNAQLVLIALTLRVAAPAAAQGTALEKHGGTDAGAVARRSRGRY